jgi:hypothetical protein
MVSAIGSRSSADGPFGTTDMKSVFALSTSFGSRTQAVVIDGGSQPQNDATEKNNTDAVHTVKPEWLFE